MPLYNPTQLLNQIKADTMFENKGRFYYGDTNGDMTGTTPVLCVFDANGVELKKGTAGGTQSSFISDYYSAFPVAVYDRNPEFFAQIGGQLTQSTGNTWDTWVVLGGPIGFNGSPLNIDTAYYFGLRIQNNNGVQRLYTCNGNGTSHTETLVTIPNMSPGTIYGNIGNGVSFYAKMTSGAKIDFYLNGILVATHTTNLPSTITGVPSFSANMRATAGTADDVITIGRVAMAFDNAITAFGAASDTTPPVVTNVQAVQLDGPDANGKYSVLITWTTDEPSTSQVHWDQGSVNNWYTVQDNTLVTDHSVTINASDTIAPNAGVFEGTVISTDASNNQQIASISSITLT